MTQAAILEDLRKGLSEIHEATNASTSTLKKIHMDSTAQEQHIARLLEDQTRRLTMFAGAAIVLAALAAVVGMLALTG